MSCVHLGGAILCIADQSEPFHYQGRLYAVDKRWGPFACTKDGDPSENQPSGKKLQAAYEFWKRTAIKSTEGEK